MFLERRLDQIILLGNHHLTRQYYTKPYYKMNAKMCGKAYMAGVLEQFVIFLPVTIVALDSEILTGIVNFNAFCNGN